MHYFNKNYMGSGDIHSERKPPLNNAKIVLKEECSLKYDCLKN